MTTVKITVGQFTADRDVSANLEKAVDLIARAAAEGSHLVVLPENSMYSDPAKEAPEQKYAEAADGSFVSALGEAAAAHGVSVLAGITETNDQDERPFNTLVLLDAQGRVEGTYRKVHLYDAFGYRESDTVTPAPIERPLVFEREGVRFGAVTCYDLRFPEIARWLVDAGADVILLPAAWAAGPMKELHWETLIRARAIENTAYVAASGQTGPHCTGQSMIVDPMGVVLASGGEAPGALATASVSSERVAEVRAKNPSLSNRQFSVVPRSR